MKFRAIKTLAIAGALSLPFIAPVYAFHYFTVRPLETIIFADTSTSIPLQDPTGAGGPVALGQVFIVVDNLGTAAIANITPTGPIAGVANANGTPITTAYGSTTFRWIGNTYTQK